MNLPACLPTHCSVNYVLFCFFFYFYFPPHVILQIFFFFFARFLFYLHRYCCKDNLMKWLAKEQEEPPAARYLSTEANRNARSTKMILVIVDNYLKTFPLHLLWLHLCGGLDTPHNNTMITSCCIQAALFCSCSLAAACFLWASYLLLFSFSMNLIPEAWLKARPKVTGDVPPGYFFWESDLFEKKKLPVKNLA